VSADNGIYVLESTGPEYRVAHAQAIENICWKPDMGEFNRKKVVLYFGGCHVLRDRRKALIEAERQAKGCPILEYGIQFIEMPFKFPETTDDQGV
jgi:hypothetical protein